MKSNILIVIMAVVLLSACKNQPSKPMGGGGALPIPVVEVSAKDVVGYQSYPVNIEGKVNNAVRAKISGYIKEVYIDEGQHVTKGQPLFRLETDVQTQTAHAANAAINSSEAMITSAKAAVNAAQVEVDKLTPLVEKNIISKIQLETAKANLSRAVGQLEQAKAGKLQAQANYSSIRANIDFAVVRSPVSGVVGSINYREGSLVGPSDPMPITTVSETSEVYAYFSMNEAEYLNFLDETPGKAVKDKLNNLPLVGLILANGQEYSEKGKIQTVTGQIDPQTGSIKFRAVFRNPNGLLSNGNSGFVHIPKSYKDILVIPESATYEQQGVVYVFVSRKDTVYSTPITVEDRIDNMALVQSGLKKGDIVAVKGIGKLRNATLIQPVPVKLDSIVNAVKAIM